jgi:TctA family transporter
MTRKGQAETALGICLWFSALGGIAGTLALSLSRGARGTGAQLLDLRVLLLAFLGLMCATLVARSSPVKAIAAMLIGLLVAASALRTRRHPSLHSKRIPDSEGHPVLQYLGDNLLGVSR